ncbi:MAG TPA: SRPBCC family protein [Streptosporangiaceae bacterium]|jgi:hypothetical protein|nr:SRPBCC family protein [Streptosporangiaceae bacterium]
MPTPIRIAARVTVDAEPERVWQVAVDWPRQREWIWATRVRGGHGMGADVTGWTGIGPVGFTDPMVISEWDPPRRCVVTHTGRVVRGTGVFEVSPHPAGSQFSWIENVELPLPPGLGRLAGWVAVPVAAWGLRSSLSRFARLFSPS